LWCSGQADTTFCLEELNLPDLRQHRGPHPEDKLLFAADQLPSLREAVSDLSWLFNRGYASQSATEIVGNRYSLDARQRLAVARCAAADEAVSRRKQHQQPSTALRGEEIWLDGYNILTSLEAALSGGVILEARDGCFRDMASMHGSYRKVEETIPAIELLGNLLAGWGVATCHWLLDQPVSNSGRLKTMLREVAEKHDWSWQIELVPNPDAVLSVSSQIVASSDSQIVDRANRWFNLARESIERCVPEAWIVRF
jgi:hypothetical protein